MSSGMWVSSIWQDQISLKANSNLEVVPLETEIEIKRQTVAITGILTVISTGSGNHSRYYLFEHSY
jgi:hypothetical protein